MAKLELQNSARLSELCSDLNLDLATRDEALREFDRIKDNYTLEGDPLHWIACALYEACRRRTVPTIDNGQMEGNGVSLTRLLRTAKFSLIQFFNKIKKWADMANLPESFRSRIDKLERNFSVSTVIFKKYRPIFLSVFKNPDQDPPKPPRSRKQRPRPCTCSDIYEFIWRIFVLAKGNFPDIGDDLVNCYHLLLCVIDWVYINCIIGKRFDLINPDFDAPPTTSSQGVPCIISHLCSQHEGLEIEAKGIKEHHFKNYIKRLCSDSDKPVLKGTQTGDNFVGILDINFFIHNSKAVDEAYDAYVLTLGDFDERIFLGKDANIEIGTPAKQPASGGSPPTPLDGPSLLLEAAARSNADAKLREHLNNTQSLCPKTPLTGRQHLPDNHTDSNSTPITSATQGVSKLQALLAGRKPDTLTEDLLAMFKECSTDIQKGIEDRVVSMGEAFCEAYTMPCNNNPGSQASFAQNRLKFSTMLYYKVLESIVQTEKKKLQTRMGNKTVDLSGLLEQDIFHRSLFACCLEIVIFCYNSQRTFPWVLAVFDLQPYHFYKVIELLIRAEENFSRDIIKHLNCIEESILDCLAWKSDSPLWDYIARDKESNKSVLPSSEEVALQQPTNPQHPLGSPLGSPMTHPQIRRLAMSMSDGKLVNKKPGEITIYSPGHSPSRAPLASDRFSSPVSGTARRRLFPAMAPTSSPSSNNQVLTAADGHSPAIKQQIITFQQTSTDDGRQILIPVQIVQNVQQPSGSATPTTSTLSNSNVNKPSTSGSGSSANGRQPKAKRTGSLALFFRKVYHLASVRLKDLCDKLGADDQLRRRVWTTFEHCLVHEVQLMKDRHLDQFIMCAVYAICKVSGNDQSFQDIMKCYRLQPQAQSHVYRSVLLRKLGPTQSGSQAMDNLSQQSTDSDSSDRIQERLNTLRSSSTLPSSQSGSAPPTPTRASGASTGVYENEERGDVIKFYNLKYVQHMKSFILRFQGKDPSNLPALSSLPKLRQHQTSPRRVSNKHSIYLSPHKVSAAPSLLTPDSRMLYCFNSSPARDLRAINNMLRKSERKALTSIPEKRTNSTEVAGGPPIKALKFDQSGPAS